MSRGVVLWPDATTSVAIVGIWDLLASSGLPSMSTHTHRMHVPHVSLLVAEDLPVREALTAVGRVPAGPIGLRIVAAGMFPQGNLFLAPIVTPALLQEQQRVRDSLLPLAVEPWPYFTPEAWTPHITMAWALAPDQIGPALSIVLRHLPLEGRLGSGGVEDGTTGEQWPTS